VNYGSGTIFISQGHLASRSAFARIPRTYAAPPPAFAHRWNCAVRRRCWRNGIFAGKLWGCRSGRSCGESREKPHGFARSAFAGCTDRGGAHEDQARQGSAGGPRTCGCSEESRRGACAAGAGARSGRYRHGCPDHRTRFGAAAGNHPGAAAGCNHHPSGRWRNHSSGRGRRNATSRAAPLASSTAASSSSTTSTTAGTGHMDDDDPRIRADRLGSAAREGLRADTHRRLKSEMPA
jgi:hypothetical protein